LDKPVQAQTSSSAVTATAAAQPRRTLAPIRLATAKSRGRRLFERESDFQIWSPVFLFARKGRVRGMFEVNPRVGIGTANFDQLIIRPALGLQLTKHISVWQGYAWIPTFLPEYVPENRIWQQILIENRFPRWTMQNRFRLEQRMIQGISETASRFRYFNRTMIGLKKGSPWALALQEEIFINLNEVSSAITPGINQNRIFAGLNRSVTDNFNFDIGYQYQYINRNFPVEDRHNHVLLMNWYYTFRP
jgi:hypothetical protein